MVNLLFGFRGRINRTQYWLGGMLSGFLISSFAVYAMIAVASAGITETWHQAVALSFVIVPMVVVLLWTSLALQVKRFHDRGRSGWMAALPFAPLLMIVLELAAGVATNAPIVTVGAAIGPYWSVLMLINFAFFIDLCILGSAEGDNKYANAPSRGSETLFPKPALAGVEAALDRAISGGNAPARTPVAPPAPVSLAAPMQKPTPAMAGSFGKRQVR